MAIIEAQNARLRIEAPASQPVRGGLVPVANRVTSPSEWEFHGVRYVKDIHGVPQAVPAEGGDKEFPYNVELIEGKPFTVYLGAEDTLFEKDRTKEAVRAAYENGLSPAIERHFEDEILRKRAVDLTPTPGTPVTNLKFATGLLQQWIAERIHTLPTLHGNRLAVALMSELVVNDSDWKLHTPQGTPIANGAGYTGGAAGYGSGGYGTGEFGVTETAVPAGSAWVYITSQVNLWEGELFVSDPAVAMKRNRQQVLAEATYMVVVEDVIGKVLVGV